VHYLIHGENTEVEDANWGKWAVWYMTVYPDGSMIKRMRVYSGKETRLEWHESMAIMSPNQKPEDILETRPALTLVTNSGEVRKYNWIDAPPTDVNYDDAIIHVINMKDRYDPFTIQTITDGNVYRQSSRHRGYSPFPSWNHWPVAQMPSDRFDTNVNHRAAHSSATHIYWDEFSKWGEKGLFVEKLLMEGLTDRSPEELLPHAKSWLQPAEATAGTGAKVSYDPAQRAYILTRESGNVSQVQVALAASQDSPVVNPVFVVPNWGHSAPAEVTVNGQPPAESLDVRQGVVRRANGVKALVVWMELTTTESVRFDFAPGS